MISRSTMSLFRIMSKMTVPSRRFCSIQQVEKAKPKLVKILEKELKYEQTNYEVDATAVQFVQDKGFQLLENEHDNVVELVKQVGDVTVTINFTARQPHQEEEEEQQEEEQKQGNELQKNDEQQEEEEENQNDFADFTVYLTKPNGQSMVYECSTSNGELQVNYVSVTNDLEAHKKTQRYTRGIEDYAGPDFNALDERLQTSFIEYLKSFGITEEMAGFVEHYSLDKEQRLYMLWLDQIQKHLKH